MSIQPGEEGDPTLGLPGPAEPLPDDDDDRDETPQINDEDDDD